MSVWVGAGAGDGVREKTQATYYTQARTPGWHALGRARRNVRASDRDLLALLLRNSNSRLCICAQPVYRVALLTRTHSCCSAKWLTSKSACDKMATRSC